MPMSLHSQRITENILCFIMFLLSNFFNLLIMFLIFSSNLFYVVCVDGVRSYLMKEGEGGTLPLLNVPSK